MRGHQQTQSTSQRRHPREVTVTNDLGPERTCNCYCRSCTQQNECGCGHAYQRSSKNLDEHGKPLETAVTEPPANTLPQNNNAAPVPCSHCTKRLPAENHEQAITSGAVQPVVVQISHDHHGACAARAAITARAHEMCSTPAHDTSHRNQQAIVLAASRPSLLRSSRT